MEEARKHTAVNVERVFAWVSLRQQRRLLLFSSSSDSKRSRAKPVSAVPSNNTAPLYISWLVACVKFAHEPCWLLAV
jgi:hypothetical protein